MVRIWRLFFILLLPLANAEQCLDDRCYECNGILSEINGTMKCVQCNEGFVMKNNECISEYQFSKNNPSIIDNFIYQFFPDNPQLGFFALIMLVVVIIYVIKHRKELWHHGRSIR